MNEDVKNGENSEDLENSEDPENTEENGQNDKSKLRGYKIVCAKLGLSMCVYFICRFLAGGVTTLLARYASGMGSTALHLIQTLVIIIMVYAIPILFTAIIFNSFVEYRGKYREMYKKPRRLARALGTFPATFGLGHGIALLTLLVSYLITRFIGGQTFIEDLLRPTVIEPSVNVVSTITMIFLLVVIAPVFEEIWTRGIMYDALKPYGTGMAILISSLLFGLMHGSLYMLLYTTAYGLAFGYIRYATNSLLIVTILHAIVNSIGASTLLLSTLVLMTNEENRVINTVNMIWLWAVLIMIIVGVAVFLAKIPAIRRFKIENTWTGIGPWKKTGWFFISIPVIIMMALAFNEFTNLLY
jgi:membrane protease YdiL (CAAX protease family)